MRPVKLGMAALVAVVLSACQSLPQVPYDRATAGNIKTVYVVTPAMPERPTVALASTVGQSFGLIGALIDAGMQSSRESDFEAIAKAQNFNGKETLMRHLDASLVANGYALVHDTSARKTSTLLKDKDFALPAGTAADAYFDIVMSYGYYASGISTPYRPYVSMTAKLVRASDKALLMQKSVFYNPLGVAPEQTVTIAPDPAYEFQDFDALKADPEKAIKGMDVALQQVAGALGTLLK
jgi:hypothetical protein